MKKRKHLKKRTTLNKRKVKKHNNLRKKRTVKKTKVKLVRRGYKKRNKKPVSTKKVNEVVSVPVKSVNSKSMYFTKDTEQAITEYNKEVDEHKREEIYNSRIKYAFEKLVENIFNTFKFTYFDVGPLDVQKECLSHLAANIHKYEDTKGKAFSYFSIIAKHYFIFHNNSNYKRYNQQIDISEEVEENTVRLQVEDGYYKNEESKEFMASIIDYWDANVGKIFTKAKDLNIACAVIELLRNSDKIDSFNKKALYLYIREISSCKTQQITKVINKMKKYQKELARSYVEFGKID